MRHPSLHRPWIHALRRLSLLALAIAAGCTPDARTRYGYRLSVPPEWKAWSSDQAPVVPGEWLEGYEVPTQGRVGSFIVFRSGYLPETSAAELAVQTRHLLLNLPTLEIAVERTESLAGVPAVRLEAVASGNGAALAASGLGMVAPRPGDVLVPTRRVWVRVPRGQEAGTLELLFHCAESDQARIAPTLEGILASLTLER